MHRTIATLCLLAVPFVAGCVSHSTKHFVGSEDYELVRRDAPDGAREIYTLRNGNSLQVATEYERERPFLGFRVEELNKSRADHRGVKPYLGLLVTGTYPESSARQAGVRENDVLLSLDGREVVYTEQLSSVESALRDQQQVSVLLLRGAEEVQLTLRTNLLQEFVTDRQNITLQKPPPSPGPYAGVELRGIPTVWSERMFGDGRNAVVVSMVEVGSPAWLAGIRGGDLIEAVDGEPVPALADLSRMIAAKGQIGQSMTWQVRREEGRTFEAQIALDDYSGTSRFYIPFVFSTSSRPAEDRWRLGLGLIMGNRNHYVSDQSTRIVQTRNVFSALLGLIKVDSGPDETRVRLLWFIHFDS